MDVITTACLLAALAHSRAAVSPPSASPGVPTWRPITTTTPRPLVGKTLPTAAWPWGKGKITTTDSVAVSSESTTPLNDDNRSSGDHKGTSVRTSTMYAGIAIGGCLALVMLAYVAFAQVYHLVVEALKRNFTPNRSRLARESSAMSTVPPAYVSGTIPQLIMPPPYDSVDVSQQGPPQYDSVDVPQLGPPQYDSVDVPQLGPPQYDSVDVPQLGPPQYDSIDVPQLGPPHYDNAYTSQQSPPPYESVNVPLQSLSLHCTVDILEQSSAV
ncbi:hypothetical protein LSAT2_018664 [Lamellibrachia satsuma]|nr:hypothetical protein LSAT2_018664 [Lamellibrachia satsuma]